MLSSSIHLTTTWVDEAKFSSLLAVLLPPRSVPVSLNHGNNCLLHVLLWVSALAQRMPRSPSTHPRWLRLESEVPLSCSGNFGLWPVTTPRLSSHNIANCLTGIFLGFAANIIVKNTGRIAWRLQFGSAFIPSFVLLCGIWFCPESPRWLMKHNKHAKGFRSMLRLRAHPIIAARDFYYSCIIYEEEIKVAQGAGYFSRMWDCFRVPRIRRANYGASTVMLAQQMCGINGKSPLLRQ